MGLHNNMYWLLACLREFGRDGFDGTYVGGTIPLGVRVRTEKWTEIPKFHYWYGLFTYQHK